MAKILNSGRDKIALQQGNSLPLNVVKFVFANIPGLNTSATVNVSQSMPLPAYIVHEQVKTRQGYVASDQVVYSIVLTPDVGNFSFNWVGLVDSDNVLIAVSYTPTLEKTKTVGLSIGNTLTRNFLVKFNDAQAITGITVPAESWQINFAGRLNSMDETIRADMSDIFGAGFFISTGFQIVAASNVVSAKAGVGYVGGYRVVLSADTVITTGVLPKDIYIDAVLEGDVSSSVVTHTFKTSTAAVPLLNYVDGLGRTHFVVKIASVTAAYAVTDLRKFIPSTIAIVEYLLAQLLLKANIASPALTGTPTAPTAVAGSNTTQLANTAFVQAALIALVNGAPATLNTLSELATAINNDPAFATTMATALGLKAPLASPALTGTPTAPTAAAGTNTTQLANTAFVQAAVSALVASSPATLNTLNELATALNNDPSFATTIATAMGLKAPLASPALTGNPTTPTPAPGDNDTSIANTAFVQAAIMLLATVARTGSAADLTGTLAAARLPFSYGTTMTAGLVAQRDGSGNLLVPDVPINESSAKAANTNFVISCVNAAINSLVAAAPGALNTLNELATALGNDANFATTITTLLGLKAPLTSPAFTGNPTAPTAAPGDNDTTIANTAFVQAAVAGKMNQGVSTLVWSGSVAGGTGVNISAFGYGLYQVKNSYFSIALTLGYFGTGTYAYETIGASYGLHRVGISSSGVVTIDVVNGATGPSGIPNITQIHKIG